ncbi:MAG: glycine/betaine ABC transporter [Clostridia bacterium]|nr:BCCT family transporter [Anaerotignum sp.]NCC16028.1 glycine/betaine ABC transporter [Clostridia bacterium]
MSNPNNKGKLSEKYEIGLMVVSVAIIVAVVVGLTAFPEQGVAVANSIMKLITKTFGSAIQVFSLAIIIFLVGLCFTKYGDIRFGNKKPKYSTISWVAMMFFCGNGAGTVYWAFLEWGYYYNAPPLLNGVPVSDAMAYELSTAYNFFHWGPTAWALLCIFTLPFAYHYYIKKDEELKFSALCKYSVGEKRAKGLFGKVIDFLFIFAAVGSISITAGTSASTIAAGIADLMGIPYSFALSVIVLLGVAVLYSISSMIGIEKGMRKISDFNVYFCLILLLFILIVGPTGKMINSIINAVGLMGSEYIRMSLWTDPIAQTGFPQDWTAFYWIYWFVFGPFTGLFVAKISEGRKMKEIIMNMLVSGSAGLFLFFGIVGTYQQQMRLEGVLDIPGMLASGRGAEIATATINTLPFPKIVMILYLIVIILFLATTLDACSFTLSSTVSKKLKGDEEPNKLLKFAWCIILVGIPIGVSYIGTDINTIKSIVLTTGLPLVVILFVVYYGFMREMFKDFGKKSKEQIIEESRIEETEA